jgi:hypothetical protein
LRLPHRGYTDGFTKLLAVAGDDGDLASPTAACCGAGTGMFVATCRSSSRKRSCNLLTQVTLLWSGWLFRLGDARTKPRQPMVISLLPEDWSRQDCLSHNRYRRYPVNRWDSDTHINTRSTAESYCFDHPFADFKSTPIKARQPEPSLATRVRTRVRRETVGNAFLECSVI